jgi:hypothetical protein
MGRRPGEQPFTFDSYWQKEKDRINKQRREKYRANRAFRKEQIELATKYYHDKVKKPTVVDRRMIVGEDGARFLSIGRVSRLIGRKISSIRRYHYDGIIPEPSFYDSRGWRLYTVHQAQLLQRTFRQYDDPQNTEVTRLVQVAELLKAGWEGEIQHGGEETGVKA